VDVGAAARFARRKRVPQDAPFDGPGLVVHDVLGVSPSLLSHRSVVNRVRLPENQAQIARSAGAEGCLPRGRLPLHAVLRLLPCMECPDSDTGLGASHHASPTLVCRGMFLRPVEMTYSGRVPTHTQDAELLVRAARLRAQMRDVIAKAKASISHATELHERAEAHLTRSTAPPGCSPRQ
jgi:hypothetical protein